MSQKMKNALALFSMAAMLFVFAGCPNEPPVDTRSKEAGMSTLMLNDKAVDLTKALSGDGWDAGEVNFLKIGVTAIAKDSKALVKVMYDGKEIEHKKDDNTFFKFDLKPGKNEITVKVIPEIGESSSKKYKIKVFAQTEAAFKTLAIENFSLVNNEGYLTEDNVQYKFDNKTDKVTLTVKASEKEAKVEVKCNDKVIANEKDDKTKFICPLNEGKNTIKIQITALDGKTKSSLVTITAIRRSVAEENVAFKTLKISNGNDLLPELEKGNDITLPNVSSKVVELELIAEAFTEGAKLEVKCNNAPISADSTDKSKFKLPLNEGDNTATVRVIKDKAKSALVTLKIYKASGNDISLMPFPDENGKLGLFGICLDNKGNATGDVAKNWKYDKTSKTYTCDILPHNFKTFVLLVNPKNPASLVRVKGMINIPRQKHSFMKHDMPIYENEFKLTIKSEDKTVTESYTIKLVKNSEVGIRKDSSFGIQIDDKDVFLQEEDGTYKLFIEDKAEVKVNVRSASPFAVLGINKEPNKRDDEATIKTEKGITDFIVKVKNGAKETTEYKLSLIKPGKNASLKSLTIDKAPAFSFESTTFEYSNIAVPYGNVNIKAEAFDVNAQVKIDGKLRTDEGYGKVEISDKKLKVVIEVTNDYTVKKYVLNFVKAENAVNVEVLVVDSIGGTKVTGTTLKVFETETGKQAGSDIKVTNGIAKVEGLKANTRYNFHLVGIPKQYAGSLIENYFVSALKNQKFTMIQFPHGDHTRGVEPPKVSKVIKVPSESGQAESEIKDDSVIDLSLKSIKVEFSSKVGAVEKKSGNGFGAKIGMGMIPNRFTGIEGAYLGTSYNKDFTSMYEFVLKPGFLGFTFPKGSFDLIVVGYDIANNRTQKHITINSESKASGTPLTGAVFTNMLMISRRTSYSENIYSKDGNDITRIDAKGKVINTNLTPYALDPIEGRSTSYQSTIFFNLIMANGHNAKIIGFDLYRRKAGVGEFERVSRTLYGTLKTETYQDFGSHVGLDTDSRLEENEEYEYKIIAYNASYAVSSPVLKMKVMEAFTYSLTSPENRAQVSLEQAKDFSYTCKLSNPKLLTKEEADRFNAGLLVLDGQGEALFGAKFRYFYNREYKDGNKGADLFIEITDGKKVLGRMSYHDTLKDVLKKEYGILKLDELIKVDSKTGIITLTPEFTKIGIFNLVPSQFGKPLCEPLEYSAGTTYQWDIQDWGDNAYDLYDDTPLLIVKNYEYDNPNGTKGSVQTQTWGNIGTNGANAINGRFTFTVVK